MVHIPFFHSVCLVTRWWKNLSYQLKILHISGLLPSTLPLEETTVKSTTFSQGDRGFQNIFALNGGLMLILVINIGLKTLPLLLGFSQWLKPLNTLPEPLCSIYIPHLCWEGSETPVPGDQWDSADSELHIHLSKCWYTLPQTYHIPLTYFGVI